MKPEERGISPSFSKVSARIEVHVLKKFSNSAVHRIRITCCLIMCLLASKSIAASNGHGQVSMSGAILASACTIGIDSLDQHIDIGTVSISSVGHAGKNIDMPFILRLGNCEIFRPGQWDFHSVRVTFDGPRDEVPYLIRLTGDAKGLGLRIKDNFGHTVIPGQTLAALPLNNGTVELRYSLAVEKNNQALSAGHYHTGVRFKVEYE